MKESTVRELLFAYDAAPVAHSGEYLHTLLDRFAQSCKSFGLAISLKKTLTMHQRSSGSNSEINVDGNSLESVDKLCYLGSTLTKNVGLNDEVAKRISKAAMNFGLLKKRAWDNNRLTRLKYVYMRRVCFLRCCIAQRHEPRMQGMTEGLIAFI